MPTHERIDEFLELALEEVPIDELSDWTEERRSIEALHGVLVALDAPVPDMSYPEFCDAVLESGTSSQFAELLEVHPRTDGPAVYRVTGSRVPDAPRYFTDASSAYLLIAGRYTREGFAVGLYDPSDFDESAIHYLDSSRLFSHPGRENQAEQIQRATEIIDSLVESSDA